MRFRNSDWPEHSFVEKRKQQIKRYLYSTEIQEKELCPIILEGKEKPVVNTFWSKAWRENVKNFPIQITKQSLKSSIVEDLQIQDSSIKARIFQKDAYHLEIFVEPIAERKWGRLIKQCKGKIDSLFDLLYGKFPPAVVEILTQQSKGLFPKLNEIQSKCTCNQKKVCEHAIALLYQIGPVFDERPDLIFKLRQVNHLEMLVTVKGMAAVFNETEIGLQLLKIGEYDSIFGIKNFELPQKPSKKKIWKTLAY